MTRDCVECGAELPPEIELRTGVYCAVCGHGQLVGDGGSWPTCSRDGCDRTAQAVVRGGVLCSEHLHEWARARREECT